MDAEKQELADRLDQVHAEIREAAIGFPPELRTIRPEPEAWCAMEILGHIAEMHYSYVARAENLIAHPGAELGRDMDSPERLEGIGRGRRAGLEEALDALEQARLHATAFLDGLSAEQMTIQGNHRALGPMTVRDVFSRTIVGHARNHLDQLRKALDQVGSQ